MEEMDYYVELPMDETQHSSRMQQNKFKENLQFSMNLLNSTLNEIIVNKLNSSGIAKKRKSQSSFTLRQSLETVLADWTSFYPLPKCSKYQSTYQRAIDIVTREESVIDADRHQHDLECLSRIAASLKLPVIQSEINQLYPPFSESTLETFKAEADQNKGNIKGKEAWVLLKNLGREQMKNKNWMLAMDYFTRAIRQQPEESLLYADRAICELELSKVLLAQEDAEDACSINPKAPEYVRTRSKVILALNSSTPQDFFVLAKNLATGENGFLKDREKALRHLKVAVHVGHLEAEFFLGQLLLELEESKAEGFLHIQHAAEGGLANAQFEMGLLLSFGVNFPRHESNARKWLIKARSQGFVPLVESSISGLSDGKDWVEQMLKIARQLTNFESENHFNTVGMSILERQERFTLFTNFLDGGIEDLLKSTIHFASRIPKKSNSPMKSCTALWITQMLDRAKRGSFKARTFFSSHRLIFQAKQLLVDNQSSNAFQKLREARRQWDCPIIDMSVFVEAAKKEMDIRPDSAEAKHLLICWDTSLSDEIKLKMASSCVKLQPGVADFHFALAIVRANLGNFGKALESLNRALKLNKNSEWLFHRATFLRLHNKCPDLEVVDAYERFLLSNPPESRYIPHANYGIALSFFRLGKFSKAQAFWTKGQKAETNRLECFNPVEDDNWSPKDQIQELLRLGKANVRSTDARLNGKCKIVEIFCVNCAKHNPSLRCNFCCNWLCGPDEYGVETEAQRLCRQKHVDFHMSLARV